MYAINLAENWRFSEHFKLRTVGHGHDLTVVRSRDRQRGPEELITGATLRSLAAATRGCGLQSNLDSSAIAKA